MCRPESLQVIQNVIAHWTKEERMFTAYQVFQEMNSRLEAIAFRQNSKVEKERYSDVKSTIHIELREYTEFGDYARTLVDVGGKVPAFLYYPEGADVSKYNPNNAVQTPINSFTQLAADAATKIAQASVSNNDVSYGDSVGAGSSSSSTTPTDARDLTTDARGTLCVPNYLTELMGLRPGQKAHVWLDEVNGKKGLGLSASPAPATALISSSYSVDRYGNVRITKYLVDPLSNGAKASYKMEYVDKADNGNAGAIVIFTE